MQTSNVQVIAYIAGIMDGEGTITLTRIHKSDPYRTPVVSELLISTYKNVTVRNGRYSERQRQAKLDFEREFFLDE